MFPALMKTKYGQSVPLSDNGWDWQIKQLRLEQLQEEPLEERTPPSHPRQEVPNRFDIDSEELTIVKRIPLTSDTAKIIGCTPRNAEIDWTIEDSLPVQNAAPPPSPTRARHDQELYSETNTTFEDSCPSLELSSLSIDLRPHENRRGPVPLNPRGQCTNKISLCPSYRPDDTIRGDIMPGKTVQSHYNDDFLPNFTTEAMDHIVELGKSSPGSKLPEPWAEPAVSYVPATYPSGPRDLPLGHYACPSKGCPHRLGKTRPGSGYTRETLRDHILNHGGRNGMTDLRWTVRQRVMAMRRTQRRKTNDGKIWIDITGDLDEDLQRETDDLVLDLEEIRNWEQAIRVAARRSADATFADQVPVHRSPHFTSPERKIEVRNPELARREYAFPRDSFRFQDYQRPRQTSAGVYPNDQVRSSGESKGLKGFSLSETTVTDSDHSPPRKKVRKVRPERDCEDSISTLGEDDDYMDLD